MGEETKIQWTDHTFNAWIGCEKVSAACKHCYAEVSTPARTARANGLELWGPAATTARTKTSAANWKLPERWNRAAERAGVQARVFCSSLADVFEDHPSVGPWRAELFALIERTPHLDWQLLTKRPQNLRRMLPAAWLERPRENVWLGTTVEDQRAANERIPQLLSTPAAVRFLSCEPLLGPVDLDPIRCDACDTDEHVRFGENGEQPWCIECDREAGVGHWLGLDDRQLDWVIVGGESGHNARPFDLAWARAIVKQCKDAGTAVFVKQLGFRAQGEWLPPNPPSPRTIRLKDCRNPDPSKHRFMLDDPHGGDMNEWPSDLCVREMPRNV